MKQFFTIWLYAFTIWFIFSSFAAYSQKFQLENEQKMKEDILRVYARYNAMRTFTGSDAQCRGVLDGWAGLRLDTDEIQMCFANKLRRVHISIKIVTE